MVSKCNPGSINIVSNEEKNERETGVGGFEPPTYSLGGCRPVLTRPHALPIFIIKEKV